MPTQPHLSPFHSDRTPISLIQALGENVLVDSGPCPHCRGLTVTSPQSATMTPLPFASHRLRGRRVAPFCPVRHSTVLGYGGPRWRQMGSETSGSFGERLATLRRETRRETPPTCPVVTEASASCFSPSGHLDCSHSRGGHLSCGCYGPLLFTPLVREGCCPG